MASEVKALAGQTGTATDAIAGQIAAVQNSTAEVVAVIGEIAKAMADVHAYAQSISTAIQQQSVATSQIRDNVRHAAAGSHTVSSNLKAVSAAASETSRSAAEVTQASKDVAERTQDLSEQITAFLKNVAAA